MASGLTSRMINHQGEAFNVNPAECEETRAECAFRAQRPFPHALAGVTLLNHKVYRSGRVSLVYAVKHH